MRTLLLILSFICLTACANFGSRMINHQQAPAMKGQSVEVLTKRWGKPSLVGQAANGNRVYAYITESSNYAPSARVLSGRALAPQNETKLVKSKCTSLVEIDKNNIIVSATNHGNC